jgi:hypothetical protein
MDDLRGCLRPELHRTNHHKPPRSGQPANRIGRSLIPTPIITTSSTSNIMKEEVQQHQQQQQRADASVLDSSVARILPPSQEISPTKSSLRLMRQISGLGMEDPVFGLAFFDDHRGDTSNSDSNNHNNNSSNSNNHHHQKMIQRRGSMLPLPMMDLLFQDMGFEDLPRDMRDAMSVASDPTAAYCPEQADKMLMRLCGRGGGHNNNNNNIKKKNHTNNLLRPPSTPETSTNNSYSHAEEEQQQQQQHQPVVVPHDDKDMTTCTMTKNTLLAEAAQALEGRVSSNLLAAARHQIYGNRNGPKASRRASLQHCHGGGAANNIRNHKPTTTVPAPWKLQPVVSHHSSLTTLDQHRHHRVLPSLEHIFPV